MDSESVIKQFHLLAFSFRNTMATLKQDSLPRVFSFEDVMLDTDGLGCRESGLMFYFKSVLEEFIIFRYYLAVRVSFVLYIAHKLSRTLNVIN